MGSYLLNAITDDGYARLIFADTTDIVRYAHDIHGTSKTMSAVLGRSLTAAGIMGSMLKEEEGSVTLQFKGDGPGGKIICISDSKGNVRGYSENPYVSLASNSKGKLDVSGAVGRGELYVIKDLCMAKPYIGSVPIVSGEIAEDITEYYARSEQTPTSCALGVRVWEDGNIRSAGGYILQLMPGADDAIAVLLEKNISELRPISELLADDISGNDLVSKVFDGMSFSVLKTQDIEYRCTCSTKKYIQALRSLAESEMSEIFDDGPVEIKCEFCTRIYNITKDEVVI